jgi:tRNA1(Val) A37 N6-methylase TrmN6
MDLFLGGALKLRQPRKGHRAGTDAVLLAAAAAPVEGLALDIGAGVGAAGLSYAHRAPQARLGLVEIDPMLAALAADNLALNGLADRGHVHVADVLSRPSREAAGLPDGRAALVLSNPPFFDARHIRASPDSRKREAHVMPGDAPAALAAWVAAMAALLVADGQFILIHRAEAMAELLKAADGRIGALEIIPVQPTAEKAASRILLRGRKGGRAPLVIAPPLILHEGDRFTPRAEAIHRGAAL